MHKQILLLSFAAVVLLGILQWFAAEFYLYWIWWWFDYVTHFIGGFAIELFALWFILRIMPSAWRYDPIQLALIVVLIVGVGWEIFEYVNGITDSAEGYPLDIAHDMVADLLGAVCAGMIALRLMKKNNV
jgi:hypothetical protein